MVGRALATLLLLLASPALVQAQTTKSSTTTTATTRTTTQGLTYVSGFMVISMRDASVLSNPKFTNVLSQVIATLVNVSPYWVNVTFSVNRRLAAPEVPRALQVAQTIHAGYLITIPPGSGLNATDMVSQLQQSTTASVASSINRILLQAGFSSVGLTVSQMQAQVGLPPPTTLPVFSSNFTLPALSVNLMVTPSPQDQSNVFAATTSQKASNFSNWTAAVYTPKMSILTSAAPERGLSFQQLLIGAAAAALILSNG